MGSMVKHKSHWNDVFAKARKLVLRGAVTVRRNGLNDVDAIVKGDHGTYNVEISRDDPDSRAITQWTCTCPWDQFAWHRTGPWQKYEGRVCSHVLAAYWVSRSTPLDEDAHEQGYKPSPGQKGPAAPAPSGPGGMMPEMQEAMPEGEGEEEPEELPTQQPALPQAPTVPYQRPGEEEEAPQGGQKELPPLEQGLLDLQKQLSPEEYNFLQQKFPAYFKIPGTFSSVTEDWEVRGAGDDFEAIHGLLFPSDPSQVPQSPTGRMSQQVSGEYRQGKHPHPNSLPGAYRQDGSPLYPVTHMGYDPETGQMLGKDGPEKRGEYGEIPAGAVVQIIDADPSTKWVRVQWPVADTKALHARFIDAWIASKDVKLVGSERQTPFIRRHGPKPDETDWQEMSETP